MNASSAPARGSSSTAKKVTPALHSMARASFIVVLLTVATPSSIANAHGGPPAIENVIASDSDGPWLAELSEGFALRDADGAWSFLCPAAFASDSPPISAAAGDVVWASGSMDLFQLSADHALLAADRPDLASARVLALGTTGADLLALRVAEERGPSGNAGTELVRIEGDGASLVFQDLSALWSVLAVQPEAGEGAPSFWLARIDGQSFELLGVSETGEEVARATTPWASQLLSIRLSIAGHDVFIHVYDNLGYSLVHAAAGATVLTEGAMLAHARTPMRGPVVLDDVVLFTQDDQLMEYSEEAAEPSDRALAGEALTCLAPPYAATASRLYAIDTIEAAGGFRPGDALLDLPELRQPALRPADAELGDFCTAQWLVFQGDLQRVGIGAADGGVPDGGAGSTDAGSDASFARDASTASSASSSGCSAVAVGHARARAQLIVLGLCATAIYARRRRAQSRSRPRG